MVIHPKPSEAALQRASRDPNTPVNGWSGCLTSFAQPDCPVHRGRRPSDIVSFHERLVAHGWPRDFGSGKSPAMSYATVQGPEALVEKFRNSSVMLETFDYHPVGLVRQVTEFLGHAMATAPIIASSRDSPQCKSTALPY
ncbi:hypothetical protein HDK64DRAFT_258978 [Phyllosticta capitalensis]